MATLTVTFTAGADGGSPITGASLSLADKTDAAKVGEFEVTLEEFTAGSATVEQADIESTAIGALVEGQVLTIAMTASNANGASPKSQVVDAAPFSGGTTPGMPEAPSVTAGTWA